MGRRFSLWGPISTELPHQHGRDYLDLLTFRYAGPHIFMCVFLTPILGMLM